MMPAKQARPHEPPPRHPPGRRRRCSKQRPTPTYRQPQSALHGRASRFFRARPVASSHSLSRVPRRVHRPDRVQTWWRRNPAANIGIPTGARSGVLVVDVDVHGTHSGYAAFDRARTARLVDAWGWLTRTPSGGLHAYFPAIRGVEQRSWQVPGQHIDFRGDGGYVIAPPSRITVEGECRRLRGNRGRTARATTTRCDTVPPTS